MLSSMILSNAQLLPSLLVFQKRVYDFHDAGPQDLFDVNLMENNVTAPMEMWFGHFHKIPCRFFKTNLQSKIHLYSLSFGYLIL